MGGTKHDDLKPDFSLIPSVAERQLAYALMSGAKKYTRNNYRQGFDIERLIAAASRHLSLMKDGEVFDDECSTQLGHLVSHAACVLASMAMLLECGKRGTLTTLDHGPNLLEKYRNLNNV